jgi:hypothetical protein
VTAPEDAVHEPALGRRPVLVRSSLLLRVGGLVLSQERLPGHLTSTRLHLETRPGDNQT